MAPEPGAPQTGRRGLPLQLTSFVGRAREVREVRALLGRTRLLTLTGSGGVGKTRLALEAAAGVVDDYPDGLWYVDLAPLADPVLVAPAVGYAGGVAEQAGVPAEVTLTEVLGDRRILLLLDNCEHLVESCARLADALLRVCSGLRILATSRELLGTSGEVTWPVPALTLPPANVLPTPEALGQSEAVRLFAERATAARPDFELTDANGAAVARICCRLDGVPLALELAAARLRALSPEQIATRLDDRFRLLTGGNRAALPRHQTLAAAVTWSYDLLGEAERVLFRRLSVFAGGWTIEAAEAVCGSPSGDGSQPAPEPALDTLARLVDRSLVLADEAGGAVRYRFLETIRRYAHERLLEGSGEEGVARRAHALYFLALAETAEPRLYEADAPTWLTRLTSEHDNLRAALRWALDAEQTEFALRLGASLYRFWRQRGYVGEARKWLAEVLHASTHVGREDKAVQIARARALNAAGVLARDAGDYAEARPLQVESVALFEVLGEDERLANAQQNLGQLLFRLGEREAARAHLEASLVRLRRLGGEAEALSASLFICLTALGLLALQEGDNVAARGHIVEAESFARQVGSPHIIAQALTNVGVLQVELGEHAAAAASLREALKIAADAMDPFSTFQALHVLASAAAAQGQVHRAAVLTAVVDSLGGRAGIRNYAENAALETRLRDTLAGLDPVARAAADADGAAMTTEEAVAYGMGDDGSTVDGKRSTDPVELLSPREREVARLITRGYSNRQIAGELVIAEPTAERHAANIFSKLGVHSRAQVAAWAVEHLHAGM